MAELRKLVVLQKVEFVGSGAVQLIGPLVAPEVTQKNLELARQNIDILLMLRDKTKGNLSEEEKGLLENLLSEIQLRFVDAKK